jgi:hypothetical protein
MFTLSPRMRLIGSAAIALLAGFLIGTFALTIPAPKIGSVGQTDIGISIHGTTAKGASVLVFGVDGELLSVTRADADGAFAFEALSPVEGTKNVFLRALDRGWRASPPKVVSIEGLADIEVTEEVASSTEELPPLGIPPTSTRPKTDTPTSTGAATSTPPRVVRSISASASVASASVKPRTNQTVTVMVKDDQRALLSGAEVTLVAHYPTENVTYIATGSNGVYRAKFRVPDNIGSGTNVLIDVTATYQSLTSTARTVFSVR